MIASRHRFAASVVCAGGAAVAVAAKSAPITLVIWTISNLFAIESQCSSAKRFAAHVKRPAPPILAGFIFAVFAYVSAIWSQRPEFAWSAGFGLVIILVFGQVLISQFKVLAPSVAVLFAGWFVVGFWIGGVLLLTQLNSRYGLYTWFLDQIPNFGLSFGSMVKERRGYWIMTSQALGNWSVAGLNMLLWPVLFVVSSFTSGRSKLAIFWGTIVLVALATFISQHQTSYLAASIGVFVYVCACRRPSVCRRFVFVGCAISVVAVAPVAHVVGHQLELQKVEWIPLSLRQRFEIWRKASELVLQAPVVGIGAGNTTASQVSHRNLTSTQNAKKKFHPHNMLLQIWLELGAVGAAIFLIGFVFLFQNIKKLDDDVLVFALPTVSVVFVEAVATWSIWSAWFQAVIIILVSIFILGILARDYIKNVQVNSFAEIWLPKSRLRRGIN